MNEDEAKISALRSDSSMRFVMISHSIFKASTMENTDRIFIDWVGPFCVKDEDHIVNSILGTLWKIWLTVPLPCFRRQYQDKKSTLHMTK